LHHAEEEPSNYFINYLGVKYYIKFLKNWLVPYPKHACIFVPYSSAVYILSDMIADCTLGDSTFRNMEGLCRMTLILLCWEY
jgi:hypothetical protein